MGDDVHCLVLTSQASLVRVFGHQGCPSEVPLTRAVLLPSCSSKFVKVPSTLGLLCPAGFTQEALTLFCRKRYFSPPLAPVQPSLMQFLFVCFCSAVWLRQPQIQALTFRLLRYVKYQLLCPSPSRCGTFLGVFEACHPQMNCQRKFLPLSLHPPPKVTQSWQPAKRFSLTRSSLWTLSTIPCYISRPLFKELEGGSQLMQAQLIFESVVKAVQHSALECRNP